MGDFNIFSATFSLKFVLHSRHAGKNSVKFLFGGGGHFISSSHCNLKNVKCVIFGFLKCQSGNSGFFLFLRHNNSDFSAL